MVAADAAASPRLGWSFAGYDFGFTYS